MLGFVSKPVPINGANRPCVGNVRLSDLSGLRITCVLRTTHPRGRMISRHITDAPQVSIL
jgi:hypothetical protein